MTEVSMKPELYSAHPMATDNLTPRPRVHLPTNGMVRPWTTTFEVESQTKSLYLQKKVIVTLETNIQENEGQVSFCTHVRLLL